MSKSAPKFSDYGKSVKDLFKKKYDFDHQIKTTRKAAPGVSFETTGTFVKGGDARGQLVAKHSSNPYVSFEGQVDTDAARESKIKFTTTKLARGVTVSDTITTKDDDIKGSKLVGVVDVDYVRDHLSASLTVKSDLSQHRVKTSASVAAEGFSVGGSVAINATNGAELTDYNAGLQYTPLSGLYSLSSWTEKKFDVVNASASYKCCSDLTVGALVKSDLAFTAPKFTVGADYKLSPAVNARAKYDSDNTVSAAIEFQLYNPRLAVGVAAAYKPAEFASKGVGAQAFGLTMNFGDI